MTRPKLSIVMPIHRQPGVDRNAAFERVLHSLTLQTENDFEVLVCSDGAGDEVSMICQGFAERLKIRFMQVTPVHAPPAGAAYARNVGITQAYAPRVLFLDCDCLADPKTVAAHAKLGDAAWAVIGLRRHLTAAVHKKLNAKTWPTLDTLSYRREMRDTDSTMAEMARCAAVNSSEIHRYVYTCHVSYPTNVLQQVGGFWTDMKGSGAEDQELALRCHRRGCAFVLMREPPVYHQDHPNCPQQVRHIEVNRRMLQQTQRNSKIVVRNKGSLS